MMSLLFLLRRYCRASLLAAALVLVSIPLYASPDRYVLITILHTNDMHGTVMPEGGSTGLAKIATMVKRIRADMPNVVLMDAGDIIHGSFDEYLSGGKAIISCMNAAGYDCAATGNHEYDFGLDTTRGVFATACFPFIAANVKDRATGGAWDGLQPCIIKTVDGVRIAVFGLATLQTVDLEWPARIADIRFDDPIETAKALVPELRKHADVVVALSHLGFADDKVLAEQVPGIDFIVGGHSHTVLDNWTWVGNTLITQAGAMGAFLGRIDFVVRLGDNGSGVASVNGRDGQPWSKQNRTPLSKVYPDLPLIPVTADIPDDPAVVQAYMPYHQKAQQTLCEVIGQTCEGIPATASDESMAGNLVADAVRWTMNSDAAAVDPASIANAIPPGRITVEQAFRLIGGYTRQNLVKVEMTGAAIRDVVSGYLAKRRSPPMTVSGMTITYKLNASGTRKPDQITIGGAPLDPAKVYTVASQAYLIMDWQKIHPEIHVMADPTITTREAIVSFIKDRKTVDYKPEGRVRGLGF